MNNKDLGTFYGVGLGPGDPELLTLKALKIIKGADTVAVPRSEDGSVAMRILEGALGTDVLEDKELLELTFPMTRDADALGSAREEAAARIAEKLTQGHDVAFITLGDPTFYSTFSYLVPYVRLRCPEAALTIVPGVTAPSAASAALQSALCEGDAKVAIIPAVYDPEKIRDVFERFDTIVLMKVNKVVERVIDLLEETGLTDKAVLVSKVSWEDEGIVTDIKTLRGAEKPPYFSMIIVRK
jgi:precorrin-2/cobalt-factor-2 C20-methyltransferase